MAVLGAGVMGAQIAAHFANAGVPSLLLDLTAEAAESAKVTPSLDFEELRRQLADWDKPIGE